MGKLERVPGKQNWVDRAGGLPNYIERIAVHVHAGGKDIGHSIAIAVNAAKKMCASGDTNFKGKQNVNAASRGQACAAVAEWERKKAGARVSKGIRGRKMSDAEYIEIVAKAHEVAAEEMEFDSLLAWAEGDGSGLAVDLGKKDTRDDFQVTGDISKVDTDQRLVFGWASVGSLQNGEVVVDRQGDVLDDVDEIEKAAYKFVLHSRDGGEMHIRKGVSTLVESFVSTPEKRKAMGLADDSLPNGWWVGFRVNDDNVWSLAKSGHYKMFSVHGKGVRKAIDDDA